LIGCSRYIENWYRKRGIKAGHFGTLRNGVDTVSFSPVGADVRVALRERFGLPADRFVVLYSGRISPEKGPDMLAAAFAHLDPARYHWAIVGEWPQGDASVSQRVAFAHAMKEQMRGLPVTLLGCRAPETMAEVYRAADLLAIPSRMEEPFSMVAIEAMACGLPVLALAKGGMVEYMNDGENARLLSARANVAEFAVAIEAVAADAKLRAKIATGGRSLVVEHFDWNHIATDLEALYDRLLGVSS